MVLLLAFLRIYTSNRFQCPWKYPVFCLCSLFHLVTLTCMYVNYRKTLPIFCSVYSQFQQLLFLLYKWKMLKSSLESFCRYLQFGVNFFPATQISFSILKLNQLEGFISSVSKFTITFGVSLQFLGTVNFSTTVFRLLSDFWMSGTLRQSQKEETFSLFSPLLWQKDRIPQNGCDFAWEAQFSITCIITLFFFLLEFLQIHCFADAQMEAVELKLSATSYGCAFTVWKLDCARHHL